MALPKVGITHYWSQATALPGRTTNAPWTKYGDTSKSDWKGDGKGVWTYKGKGSGGSGGAVPKSGFTHYWDQSKDPENRTTNAPWTRFPGTTKSDWKGDGKGVWTYVGGGSPSSPSGGGGGPVAGGGPSSAQAPPFYNYLQKLPNEIDAVYEELKGVMYEQAAMLWGYFDGIGADLKSSYAESLALTRKGIAATNPMLEEAGKVVMGHLTGELVDPVVNRTITEAVGLTGSLATSAGAPIKGNTYLTQAATTAGVQAAAPIKLAGMAKGVEMLPYLQQMYGTQAQMPYLPQMAGAMAGEMLGSGFKQAADLYTSPMDWRLPAQMGASNLMGNAITQTLQPYQMGAQIGNMWAPYSYSTQDQTRKVTPLPTV